jgi:predicted ATPase/DNA-binding winged helix-turn-helix (wHTH) protein
MTLLQFDNFEIDLYGRSLKKEGKDVRLGSRAFDLLAALVSRPGEVLSKAELIAAVWPETYVEESSLRVNIVALRKVLGDGGSGRAVENVAGRGYTFTISVRKMPEPETHPSHVLQTDLLPTSLSTLVGRENLVESWAAKISSGITTIVGQGGIGKTSIAIRIAGELQRSFDAVHFVDVADRECLSGSRLAIALQSENVPEILLETAKLFEKKSVLMVLDGCDCGIERAALVAEALADSHPQLAILATSREPLGIIGENVLHLSGLTVPSQDQQVEDISAFTGVELFADRVSMFADDHSIMGPQGFALVAEIVRKTDGNPLAIELAASRVSDLGLENLVSSLDHPLRALRRGNRTSHPRLRNLRANIDWSYDLLNGNEKFLLGQLGGLGESFTRKQASAVVGLHLSSAAFEEAFDALVLKSLVLSSTTFTYSLPRLIREYAYEKLCAESFDRAGISEARVVRSGMLPSRHYQTGTPMEASSALSVEKAA